MRFYSTFRTNEEGLRLFTRSEVAAHNTDEDLWVIIDGRVYDLSMWINFHPGGRDPLIEMAGKGVVFLFFLLVFLMPQTPCDKMRLNCSTKLDTL